MDGGHNHQTGAFHFSDGVCVLLKAFTTVGFAGPTDGFGARSQPGRPKPKDLELSDLPQSWENLGGTCMGSFFS